MTFTPPSLDAVLPLPFAWSTIPAGSVTIDYTEGSTHSFIAARQQTFELPAFFIATYPVTTDQYQVFLDDAGGYQLTKWWSFSQAALDWRREWPEPSVPLKAPDNAPRTRICWYEAVAFCRWLEQQTEKQDGWVITLPTEQQWQRAAQGDDGRLYPWGNDFNPAHARTGEVYSGAPAPVTAYPGGASPYGVLDMGGNTWEWTLSQPGTQDIGLRGGGQRVLRGGSWSDPAADARCVARFAANPHSRDSGFGLRLACVPAPTG
jgi:formylglycine-generating enzyme required for sulfatase activity